MTAASGTPLGFSSAEPSVNQTQTFGDTQWVPLRQWLCFRQQMCNTIADSSLCKVEMVLVLAAKHLTVPFWFGRWSLLGLCYMISFMDGDDQPKRRAWGQRLGGLCGLGVQCLQEPRGELILKRNVSGNSGRLLWFASLTMETCSRVESFRVLGPKETLFVVFPNERTPGRTSRMVNCTFYITQFVLHIEIIIMIMIMIIHWYSPKLIGLASLLAVESCPNPTRWTQ